MRRNKTGRMRKAGLVCIMAALCLLLCFFCSCSREEDQAVSELEYTVVPEEELPEELKTIIDEKKTGEFKLTYVDGEYLYIVVGYGKQTTGGYSIQIPRVYLTEDSIVFESQLMGPGEDARANISYPYAVIKTEKRQEPVIFK